MRLYLDEIGSRIDCKFGGDPLSGLGVNFFLRLQDKLDITLGVPPYSTVPRR